MKDNSSAETPKINKMGFEGKTFRKTSEKADKGLGSVLKNIPNRKTHLDFVIALLTVPILLTAIVTNIINLQNANKKAEASQPSPTQPVQVVIKEEKGDTPPQPTANPTSAICKKEIGPISISYPEENSEVTDNPISFIINHEDDSYCSVVWSYRINGGSWSEYSRNAPSIYNLENGTVRFELRVQSTVSDDETTLTRNFIYKGKATPTATTIPTPPSE